MKVIVLAVLAIAILVAQFAYMALRSQSKPQEPAKKAAEAPPAEEKGYYHLDLAETKEGRFLYGDFGNSESFRLWVAEPLAAEGGKIRFPVKDAKLTLISKGQYALIPSEGSVAYQISEGYRPFLKSGEGIATTIYELNPSPGNNAYGSYGLTPVYGLIASKKGEGPIKYLHGGYDKTFQHEVTLYPDGRKEEKRTFSEPDFRNKLKKVLSAQGEKPKD